MTNFEKIDDYLANRLPAEEKAAFEHELNGDPALREEVEFQQQIVRGVQQARMAELKQMLSKVPVSSGGWSTGQVAAAVLSAGVVATSLYFYLQQDPTIPQAEVPKPEIVVQSEKAKEAPATTAKEEVTPEPANKETAKTASKTDKVVTPVQKPKIDVVDPSAELTETEEPKSSLTPGRSELSVSKLDVTTNSDDKKYNFHYQFSSGKLLLFGPFDKSLYEILEINGDSHAVFLYYKENYYLLDEAQSAITALTPIRDGKLLQKLREYRGR